jgi:hypothetical protein
VVQLTPYRFYAQHHVEKPATHRGTIPIVEDEGHGFLAGYIQAWKQQNRSDMVFHTSGVRFLIDGASNPMASCGCNGEDDFGFSWGFNQYQNQWCGCPYRDNRSRNDQDGVFYRFFGPDAISFTSSIDFNCFTRADDTETLAYYYKIPGKQAATNLAPKQWQLVGLFPARTWEEFTAEQFVEGLPAGEWEATLKGGDKAMAVKQVKARFGWIRFAKSYYSTMPSNQAVYARTTLVSDQARDATLLLGFDNWATAWVNGTNVGSFENKQRFGAVEIPIKLKAGDNNILIKNNNIHNGNRNLWEVNCSVK